MRTLRLTAALGLLCAACYPADPVITPASVINSMRVLAIKSEPPELTPGTVGNVSALVVDPNYDVEQLTYIAVFCDPTTTGNACSETTNFTDTGAIAQLLLNPNSGVHVNPFGSKGQWHYTAPAASLDSLPQGSDQRALGVNAQMLLIIYEGDIFSFQDTSILKQFSLKTIHISDPHSDANTNPTITSLRVNGAEASHSAVVKAGSIVEMSALASAGSAEVFTRHLPDGTTIQQTEQTAYSWYSTAGTFDPSSESSARTNGADPIHLTLPATTANSTVTVYAVLRDGRGGTDWSQITLVMQ